MLYTIPSFSHNQFIYADEWAESNVVLRDSGPFRFDVTPYLREPTRAASDTLKNCRVVVSTPAQCGKTQMIVNLLAHMAVYDPTNSLVILDTAKTALRLSKNRIKPFLREFADVKSLKRGVYVEDRSSSVANISLGSGANLIFGSSGSASDLCSTPVKYLFLDELDRFVKELDGEGDPILLALKRQLRFMDSMAVLTSTPTVEEGAITQHYNLGTQEEWCVLCHCGALMRVMFDDISFAQDTPVYTCDKCGEVFSEIDIKSLVHTYSEPNNKEPYGDKYGRICRSFRIHSTLMHGIYSWDQLEKERQQAEALGLAAVRSFRNTTLGEAYTPPTFEITDYTGLLIHRHSYTKENLFSWVTDIFAGIDTQDSLFEIVIIGMSVNHDKICFIEHKQIVGDLEFDASVWARLKAYISDFRCSTTDGRTLYINLLCHDCGGHFYNEVLSLGLQIPWWRPVKGRSYQMGIEEQTVIDRISRKPVRGVGNGTGKVDLTFVNTRYCKDFIYDKLSSIIANRDAGFYFTADSEAQFDENFFEQLTSETKETASAGYSLYKLKIGFHNECLDCTVYALAAAELYRLMSCKIASIRKAPIDEETSKQEVSERHDEAKQVISEPAQMPIIRKTKKLKSL